MAKIDEKEKDVLKDMPVRDLLRIADPALNNFMLLAVVESGNSPQACFELISKYGISIKELAPAVKAAVWAKIKLGNRWDDMRRTSSRPAETMLRFGQPAMEGTITLSNASVFGDKEFDHARLPILLREFLLYGKDQEGCYVTSLDYDGTWPSLQTDPDSLYYFSYSSSNDHYWAQVKYDDWEVTFRQRGCYWHLFQNNTAYYIQIKTILLAPQLRLEEFPKCYKVVEIVQELKNNERERVRIRLQQDKRCYPNDAVVFEKLARLNGPWEAKLSIPFYVTLPYESRPGEWVDPTAKFNGNGMYPGFYSVGYKDDLSLESPPNPPFHLQTSVKDPYKEFAKLAEQISAVEEVSLESIFGQTFLDNPPKFLHDLFIKK